MQDLGISFGDDTALLPAQDDNPEGFAEHRDVVGLSDDLLRSRAATWYQPPASSATADGEQERVDQLRTRLATAGVLGIKDPRISLLLPAWFRDGDAVWVCVRHPVDVCQSLARRDGFPFELSAALWLLYYRQLAVDLDAIPHDLMWYSALESGGDETDVVARIAYQLGLPEHRVSEQLAARYKPAMDHANRDMPATGPLLAEAVRLYGDFVSSGSLAPIVRFEAGPALSVTEQMGALVGESRSFRELAPQLEDERHQHEALRRTFEKSEEALSSLAAAHEAEKENHQKLEGEYQSVCEELASLADAHASEMALHSSLKSEYDALSNEQRKLAVAHQAGVDQHNTLKSVRANEPEASAALAAVHTEEVARHDRLKAQHAEEQAKSEYLFHEWNLTRERLEVVSEELKVSEGQVHGLMDRLYRLRESNVGALMYFQMRAIKFLTWRRSHYTFLDWLFRDVEVPAEYLRPRRLRLLRRLAGFAYRNPSIVVRNLNPRNLGILLRQFTGDKTELEQWLGARIPVTGNLTRHALARFDLDDVLEFPVHDRPVVSILIPVYNQVEVTLSLLKTIHQHTPVPYEVIIADDCSTDETQYLDRFVTNVRHVRHPENLGFLRNCNTAAIDAKGEFLVVLNNDTNVTEGWISSLIEVFDDPGVGVVGPKILFLEGQLQEAGGIIWQDGSGWNYGRMQDPEEPEYNYRKPVDYVSGCCLVIRTSLWQEIGGFDERYVPAYYEDTDLCFEVRKRGYDVVYQPASVIYHLEGVSHGTDTSTGIKQYQVTNAGKFRDKWASVLADADPNAENVFRARDRSHNKKTLLFIDHYVPHYDKDAGSRAVFMYLQTLVEMGVNVKFVGDNFYKHEPYTSVLQSMGIEVLYGNRFLRGIDTWIRDNRQYIDAAFINRPHIASRYIDLMDELGIRTIYFGHDLHFLRLGRQAALEQDESIREEADKWQAIELDLIRRSDVVYYPSVVEEKLLTEEFGQSHASVLPLYAYPTDGEESAYVAGDRKGILFVGGFGHPPNVDAVEWFHQEIFPLLDDAGHPVHIVGSGVPDHIQAMHSDRFQVLGFQSDEALAALYARVALVVVPLRYGAGVKGKVLEALYHGVPLVSTSVGLEGIAGVEEVAFGADSPDEFAGVVNRLATDGVLCEQRALAGRAFIQAHFSREHIKAMFSRDLFV